MARKRTGQLIKRPTGWYARISTLVDGERVRITRALDTQSKPAAKRKLDRMLAADDGAAIDPKRGETFREAAERVYGDRIKEAGAERAHRERSELANLKRVAFDLIGDLAAGAVRVQDVNAVLDAAKAGGLAHHSVHHVRQRVSNVFSALVRDGSLAANPARAASMPKFAATVQRERAVLTDHEFAVYLSWEPSGDKPRDVRKRAAVRERQTMSCMARMFGGLRTGDLHALLWEAFDVEHGAFTWGYAPRQKTRRPQLLEVPAMLRPILHDHWEGAGRPAAGLVFPVRRMGKLGDRIGKQRRRVSHADAFRRDLQAAFKAAPARRVEAPAEGSPRWAELFEGTAYTLPVDFHSWRRAFAQALADADVNAQTAQALTGHASLAAHARYLRSSGKLRALPAGALPDLHVLPAVAADAEGERAQKAAAAIPDPHRPHLGADQKALAKGSASGDTPKSPRNRSALAFTDLNDINAFRIAGSTFNPTVTGSSPVRPTK